MHLNSASVYFEYFEIEDESGRATVLPEGALIEGIAAVDRYDIECGISQDGHAPTGADVTLGRRYEEMHLPLDVESMCWALRMRIAASAFRNTESMSSASSSASRPKRRARQSSVTIGCWGSVSSAWLALCSASGRPHGSPGTACARLAHRKRCCKARACGRAASSGVSA